VVEVEVGGLRVWCEAAFKFCFVNNTRFPLHFINHV
jgi:hypothetical protein